MSDGCGCPADQAETLERATLRALLAINATMFVVELGLGLWAESTGLIADGLDMLADAAVYAIALWAVGRSAGLQRGAARASGWLQLLLGLGVLAEVVRRAILGSEPISLAMMGVGGLALAANLACIGLLHKHREGGIHLRASWIFTANDAIANLGVIASGLIVLATGSHWPDLVIGAAISAIVVRGGLRILREADEEERARAGEDTCGSGCGDACASEAPAAPEPEAPAACGSGCGCGEKAETHG
ncbi:MAG: cation transporter [Deltaproteobacteria bacterium]|nr:cation transporter [Deltaproteobacteria bacterium]